MRLSELLDKESISSISSKTMISEDNIEKIMSEDYTELTKAKALGFLSILEREYNIDLKDVRHNAMSYFEINHDKNDSINIALPKVEEKHGRSLWSLLLIVALLGYASWYFFTQFDQKRLNKLLPSATTISDTTIEKNESFWSINASGNEQDKGKEATKSEEILAVSENSISQATGKKNKFNVHDNTLKEATSVSIQSRDPLQENDMQEITSKKLKDKNVVNQIKIEENPVVITKAVITPVKRLWFGLINIQTGEKDHFSMRKGYTIDLTQGDYLVATSTAPFSLQIKGEIYRYNNGRVHYFKITKSGLTPLSKNAYVRQGGYAKW